MANDLRELFRLAKGRKAQPTAAIMDGRALQSSPESGGRAGDDGYKRRKVSKGHIAVDTLWHLHAGADAQLLATSGTGLPSPTNVRARSLKSLQYRCRFTVSVVLVPNSLVQDFSAHQTARRSTASCACTAGHAASGAAAARRAWSTASPSPQPPISAWPPTSPRWTDARTAGEPLCRSSTAARGKCLAGNWPTPHSPKPRSVRWKRPCCSALAPPVVLSQPRHAP